MAVPLAMTAVETQGKGSVLALTEVFGVNDPVEVALSAIVRDEVLARGVYLRHPWDRAVLQADDEAVAHLRGQPGILAPHLLAAAVARVSYLRRTAR